MAANEVRWLLQKTDCYKITVHDFLIHFMKIAFQYVFKARGVATCTHGRTCVPEKIGSLRNDYGHAYGYGNKYATKQYGFKSKPMVCTCVMTSGTYTFICRTPQNNNVKLMTKFKFYRVRGTRDGDLLILCLNVHVIPTNYVPIYR